MLGGTALASSLCVLSRLLPVAVVLATSLVGVACSAPPVLEEGDPGDDTSAEALRTIAASSGTCNRAKVMASVSGARRTVLQRGFKWLDDQVPYSQSRTHEGYRTDCSGFVSMCWQTGTSFTTAIFSSGGGNATTLRAYTDLLPGDALVKRGHMMLFTGWADSAKTGICALEQASTASDMQFRVRGVSSLRGEGYKAIRSNKIASGTAPTEPTEEPTEPAEDEEPVTDPPTTEVTPPETQPAPAPSGGTSGGGAAPPPPVAEEEPPASDPPVADDTENPQPSQLETEPSGSKTRTSDKTAKKKGSSAAEEEEDDSSSGPTAVAQQGSACTVARAGAPARGPGVGLGLGLAALAVLRRRRA